MGESTFSFETRNSIYNVIVRPNGDVEVTKTAEINPKSQFNALGQTRVATGFAFHGHTKRMVFYGADGQTWQTSEVTRFL